MGAPGTPGSIVLLTRLARSVYRRSSDGLLGIRLKHFITLSHLRDQGAVSQQALGETLCLDANNLVLLLNELEASGLIERRRDPQDRRRHIVEITHAGLGALDQAELAMETIENDVLGSLSLEERASLRALLSRALGECAAEHLQAAGFPAASLARAG